MPSMAPGTIFLSLELTLQGALSFIQFLFDFFELFEGVLRILNNFTESNRSCTGYDNIVMQNRT